MPAVKAGNRLYQEVTPLNESLPEMADGNPPPPPRRRRRVVLAAGLTTLAVVAGAVAFSGPGGDSGPPPLALVAGNGTASAADQDSAAQRMAAPTPAGSGPFSEAADKMSYAGWGGIDYEVDGDLPALDGDATAWRVRGRELGADDTARIAAVLGLDGRPEARDGGYVLETGDGGYFGVFPGPDGTSVSFSRAPLQAGDTPTEAISDSEAARVARDLLVRMDVLSGEWDTRTFTTEVGYGSACPGEMARYEGLKAAEASGDSTTTTSEDPDATASGGGGEPTSAGGDTPASVTAPDAPDGMGPTSSDCPAPPPPAPAVMVGFRPVLDNVADWEAWSVTVSGDGRIENLYGTAATFERVGDYPLRGTAAAIEELRHQGVPEPMPAVETTPTTLSSDAPSCTDDGVCSNGYNPPDTDGGCAANDTDAAQASGGGCGYNPDGATAGGTEPAPGTTFPAAEPGVSSDEVTSLPAPTKPAASGDEVTTLPAPAEPGGSGDEPRPFPAPGEPMKVRITGVTLTLVYATVWEDGAPVAHLVPAYRFTGRMDGEPWENSVVALHPDVVTPPPGAFFEETGETEPAVAVDLPAREG